MIEQTFYIDPTTAVLPSFGPVTDYMSIGLMSWK